MTEDLDQKNAKLKEQPFISHLVELRDRLIRVVIVVLLIFFGLFPFANDIYVMVADPLMVHLPEGTSMIATEVASPFLTLLSSAWYWQLLSPCRFLFISSGPLLHPVCISMRRG